MSAFALGHCLSKLDDDQLEMASKVEYHICTISPLSEAAKVGPVKTICCIARPFKAACVRDSYYHLTGIVACCLPDWPLSRSNAIPTHCSKAASLGLVLPRNFTGMFHSAYTLEFPTNRLGRLDFERFRWALYPQSCSTLVCREFGSGSKLTC